LALLAIGAAIAIGSRLSDQAVTALAGAVCGIGLAGPIGLALGVYLGSARSRAAQQSHQAQTPQVIVIPPATPPSHAPAYGQMPGALMPSQRSFTIIGEEGADDGR
jgi:hypothetical protein